MLAPPAAGRTGRSRPPCRDTVVVVVVVVRLRTRNARRSDALGRLSSLVALLPPRFPLQTFLGPNNLDWDGRSQPFTFQLTVFSPRRSASSGQAPVRDRLLYLAVRLDLARSGGGGGCARAPR